MSAQRSRPPPQRASTHRRERAATLRDSRAQWRDATAQERDTASDRRDLAATARDESASRTDALLRHILSDGDSFARVWREGGEADRARDAIRHGLDQFASDRGEAAQDRRRGRQHRRLAGQDRWVARQDRVAAGVDRGGAAADLENAVVALARQVRIVEVLVAVGEPRPPVVSWDDLTPAERRVADLVSTGLTNRDVAQRLNLSPHTVDSHLKHVYVKLGIRTRVQLTRLILTSRPTQQG